MLRYLVKRLLLFIPTLGIMSLIVFYFAQHSQEDLLLQQEEKNLRNDNNSATQNWALRYNAARKNGFHMPSFYLSLYRKSSCDTLNRIQDGAIRQNMENLAYATGSWEVVNAFYQKAFATINTLKGKEQQSLIKILRKVMISSRDPELFSNYPSLKKEFKALQGVSSTVNNYILHIQWNGTYNQYHKWLLELLQGNFGQSTLDNTAVAEKINNAIYWTLLLSFISLCITFAIAIPAAFYSSFNPRSALSLAFDKVFFLFYAIPNFWIATLLILFFASGDYFDWFPTYGLGYVEDGASIFQRIQLRTSHLVLPVIALSYGSIAFVYKQLKTSIEQELQKDYILTAKAKGLSVSAIKKYQVFKNASFPLITMLSGVIPALFSGSFIIEYVFSIPGMGKLSVDSILARDFATLYILLLMATFFSMLGLLVADLLYYFADPRVQFSTKSDQKQ